MSLASDPAPAALGLSIATLMSFRDFIFYDHILIFAYLPCIHTSFSNLLLLNLNIIENKIEN